MEQARKTTVTVLGTVAAALLAHIPCCGPTLLLAIGGGAAGAGWLGRLEPYRPLFLAVAALQLGIGFWLVYRPQPACNIHGADCEHDHHLSRKVQRAVMWAMALLVVTISLLPHHH